MKLSFRGASYEDKPPILEVTEAEIMGRNLTQPRSFPYIRQIPTPSPSLNLKEREGSYNTRQTAVEKPTLAVCVTVNESAEKGQFDKNLKITLEAADKTHWANVHRSLEHRRQLARAKGDTTLLRLLEEESQQLAACGSILTKKDF